MVKMAFIKCTGKTRNAGRALFETRHRQKTRKIRQYSDLILVLKCVKEVKFMTHSIVLEIPENIYRSLAEKASKTDKKIEEIALERLAKDVAADDDEFEKLADELADFVEKNMPPDAKPLSDYAMSREGIYEDHL